MDKPRHPQVIRPWKIEPLHKWKFQAPAKSDPRHPHEGKSRPHSFRFKVPGS
jgi:hypothetical protein